MPLRARGVLETLDLSIKVYRRYFGVLMAWSGLILGVCTLVGLYGVISARDALGSFDNSSNYDASGLNSLLVSSFGAGALWFFSFPLIIGASACCVAAAVRGQRVRFAQCWSFTRPRYWAILGQTILAGFMLGLSSMGVSVVLLIIGALGAYIMTSLPTIVQGFMMVVGLIALYGSYVIVMMTLTVWMAMVPVVVCMEENHRSSATSRASALLRGNWKRAAGLSILIVLGLGAASAILQSPLILLGGRSGTAAYAGTFLAQMLFWLLATPFLSLLIALFYLDARVRNEALDLEWSAHAGTERNIASNAVLGAATGAAAATNTAQNFYPTISQNVETNASANATATIPANSFDAAQIEYSKSPESAPSMWSAPPTNFTAPQNFVPQSSPNSATQNQDVAPQNLDETGAIFSFAPNATAATTPNAAFQAPNFPVPESFLPSPDSSSLNSAAANSAETPPNVANSEDTENTVLPMTSNARDFATNDSEPSNLAPILDENSPVSATNDMAHLIDLSKGDALSAQRPNVAGDESSTRFAPDATINLSTNEIPPPDATFSTNSSGFAFTGNAPILAAPNDETQRENEAQNVAAFRVFTSENDAPFAPVFAPVDIVSSTETEPSFAAFATQNAPQNSPNASDFLTIPCPQCGADVAKNQTFCMNCGARVTQRSDDFRDDAPNFSA